MDRQTSLLILSAAALGLSAFSLGYYAGYRSGNAVEENDEDANKHLESQPQPLFQDVEKEKSSSKVNTNERVTLMLMICCVICILVTLISLIWIIFKIA